MVIFTAYTAFRIITRFTVVANLCTTCTGNRAMTGNVKYGHKAAFKTMEEVRYIRPHLTTQISSFSYAG